VSATDLRSPGVTSDELQALRRENEQLRTALATRIIIEQAKGMLAERFELHVDEAFERLRREARSRRMKLRELAAAVTAREAWTESIFRWREPTNRIGVANGQKHARTLVR
jgi:hypothetical protein